MKHRCLLLIFRFSLIFAILLIIFCDTQSVSAAWYNSSWTYRKTITLDANYISGSTNLANFPVLLSFTDTNLRDNAQADADDIFFTSSSDTILNHEIESYNSSTGSIVAWVNIPSLSPTTNTNIYMYYGNSGASNQQNPTGVWSSNFQGVWHMAEDPSISTDGDCGGSDKELCDSTSNNNDADSNGTMTTSDQVSNGKISYAQDLDGTNDYFSIPDSDTFNIGTGNMTLSLWMNPDEWENNGLMSHTNVSDPADGWWWILFFVSNGPINYSMNDTDYTTTIDFPWTELAWQYMTLVKSGTTINYYVDGALVESINNGANINNSNSNLFIGRDYDYYSNHYFDGKMDEVRFANTNRSEDWIITEYYNQSNPANFYSAFGTQEVYSGSSTPEISFSISSIGANTVNNGITTSIASSFNRLPFESLTLNTPKYAAHSLYASTNASTGYTVTVKLLNYMQGLYPGNNIDSFIAPFSNPTTWTEPTSTTPNDNTGWIGINTSDTRVANWSSGVSEKFGSLSNTPVTVMNSPGTDSGTTVAITYAIEVNAFQPADYYAGTIVYNLTPTY